MKLYVRELPQKQYHYQGYDEPVLPKNHTPAIGDLWNTNWYTYKIDMVKHSGENLLIYATKTKMNTPHSNYCYKKSSKAE